MRDRLELVKKTYKFSIFNKFVSKDDNFNMTLSQICSFFSGKEAKLDLLREYYSITLNLVMPNVDINYQRGRFF